MSINTPVVQVSSGYYNNQMPLSYARSNEERQIGAVLARRSLRGLAKVMRALNGVAPGAAVVDTQTRIAQGTAFQTSTFGGQRQIETVVTQYNGNTTTAQRDHINTQIIDPVMAQQTYPVDLSGNGGGGKVQR